MEHGFFHPSRGYWQTISEPSAEVLASYPEGTVEVPIKPVVEGYAHEWNGKEWVAQKLPDPEPVEEPPTVEALQAAIEAVAKAAGVNESVLREAGLVRREEVVPQIGGKS